MKKYILALLIVLLLVPAGLFAGIFNLSIGGTAQYKLPVDATDIGEESFEGMTDIENWAFGGDIRMRILFAELDVVGLHSKLEEGHRISGLVTAGVSLDLLGILRVGLGLGPRLGVDIKDDSSIIIYDPEGDPITGDTDFKAAFMNAPMTYRVTTDLKLGKVLVGLNYTVDSKFTFENLSVEDLAPDFQHGAIGVSVLYSLF